MLRDGWVVWHDFCALTRRFVAVADPDHLGRRFAHQVERTSPPGFALFKSVISVEMLLRFSHSWGGPSMFPRARSTREPAAKGQMCLVIEIPEDYEDSPEFFRVNRAMMCHLPEIVGLPSVDIAVEISPRRGVYRVTLPTDSRELFHRLRRAFRIVFTPRLVAAEEERRDTVLAEERRQTQQLLDRQVELARVAREAQEEAQRALLLREQFAATISHELKTPLYGILGSADLLADRALDPGSAELAAQVRVSAHHLSEIVNDLLDFSHFSTGAYAVDLETVPITVFVERTMSLCGPLVRRAGLKFAVLVRCAAPASIRIDPNRFQQVVTNLVSNAVKFTESGSVEIRFVLRGGPGDGADGDPDGPSLTVQVVDTGIGIPASALPHLFEPFRQADGSIRRRHGGTGLGLALCHRIVAAHQGTIAIESELGRGTEATVRIPCGGSEQGPRPGEDVSAILGVGDHQSEALHPLLAAASQIPVAVFVVPDPAAARALVGAVGAFRRIFLLAPFEEAEIAGLGRAESPVSSLVPQPGAHLAAVDLRSQPLSLLLTIGNRDDSKRTAPIYGPDTRVLVADDSPVVRMLAKQQLGRLGIAADMVENGRDAVERARASRYDLILMDVHMPDLDGREAARLVRAGAANGIPVPTLVAFTADEIATRRDTFAPFDDVLSKPVTLDAMATLLVRWLPPTR